MAFGKLVFIIGGVRSGKSSFAEKYATEEALQSSGKKLHYLACGEQLDNEMVERVKKHEQVRLANLLPWQTWEQPTNICEIASQFTKDDIVLIDCLTTLLSNEMFANYELGDIDEEKLKRKIIKGIKMIQDHAGTVIVVSNEVLNEPLKSESFTFTYSKLLGQLHQKIVGEANLFFLVEFGEPLIVKGDETDQESNRFNYFRDSFRRR